MKTRLLPLALILYLIPCLSAAQAESNPYKATGDTIDCDADFSFKIDTADARLVHFSDLSDTSGSRIVSWYWSFGDGASSTLQNPVHRYSGTGTFRVMLSTQDSAGLCNNSIVRQIVVGNPDCYARFDYMVDSSGREVSLHNTSEGSGLRYYWSLGDGEISKRKDPLHTYRNDGSYKVNLTIRNQDGTCFDRYEALVKIGDVSCDPGFTVFVDSSTREARFRAINQDPGNDYYWVLGDGSTFNGPAHDVVFEHPGYYAVSLTVSNTQTGCQETNREEILIGRKPSGGKAAFLHLTGEGKRVFFSDKSLGEGLSYFWNFNDGNSSALQNPEHEYAVAGFYEVCLTVTSGGLRDTRCERIFAGDTTADQCLAGFTYTVSETGKIIRCKDRSFGNPDDWLWDYDGSWTTTAQNPSWSTSVSRFLKIQQTIRNTNNGCRDDAWGLVNMGEADRLKVDFGFTVDSSNRKADSYPVDFVGVSVGEGNRLKWDFGDGTFDSTTYRPVHVYAGPGAFKVCLSIENTTTGKSDTACQIINVTEDPSTAVKELKAGGTKLLAYPNPLSSHTTIRFELQRESHLELSLFDMMGRKIETLLRDRREAGTYQMPYDATRLRPGQYYLILRDGSGTHRSVINVVR